MDEAKIHRGFWHRLRAQVEHGVDADKIASTVSHELTILRHQEYARGFNEGFAFAMKRAAEDPSLVEHHNRKEEIHVES